MFKPILFRDSVTIIPMLLRPASKGVVQLRSANPFEPPLLVPNYLTEDIDVKTMVEGTDLETRRLRSLRTDCSRQWCHGKDA